jgi:hypothetical protein
VKLALALSAAILLTSCGPKGIDNKEAVRQGVVDYLDKRKAQTGLDMNLMNVEVSNVTFQGNEARATVAFKPKDQKQAAAGMAMGYVLERRGDKWVVKGRQESGGGHGGGAMGGGMPGGSAMPPPGGGAAPTMPPNHPPVGGAPAAETPEKK